MTPLWSASMLNGGSDRQVSDCRLLPEQKCDIIVLVFPHCCPPLFHLEEMFPFCGWKQVAGQQQVSLVVVVRRLETSLHLSFILSIDRLSNQPPSPDDDPLITSWKESRTHFILFPPFSVRLACCVTLLPFLSFPFVLNLWFIIYHIRYVDSTLIVAAN